MICVEQSAKVATMQTMGERLRLSREGANFKSASKAADALGVSASSYRAHENGQNEFGPDMAQIYAKKFGTTASYLLTGEGPAKASRSTVNIISSYDPDEHEAEISDGAAYARDRWTPHIDGALPELDLKIGAGMGVVGDVINLPVGPGNISGHRVIAEWLIPQEYLRNEAKVQASVTIITEIIGDSMTPTYMPGDRVIVDLSQNKMVTDTVYAISDGMTEPQIKRLQRVPFSDPPQVRIISDNPNLETFTVELDRLHIIGRICGHIARK